MKKLLVFVGLCVLTAGALCAVPDFSPALLGLYEDQVRAIEGWWEDLELKDCNATDLATLRTYEDLWKKESKVTDEQKSRVAKVVTEYAKYVTFIEPEPKPKPDVKPLPESKPAPVAARALTGAEKVQLRAWRRNPPAASDSKNIAKFAQLQALEAAPKK